MELPRRWDGAVKIPCVRAPTRRKSRIAQVDPEVAGDGTTPPAPVDGHEPKHATKAKPPEPASNGNGAVPSAAEPPVAGRPRLGELLLARQLVSPDALREALLAQSDADDRHRLGDVLVERGALDEASLTRALADQFGLEVADLRAIQPSDEALARLPEAVARSCNAVPVRTLGDALEVVVADPTPEVRAALAEAIRGPIELLVASPTDVRRLLDSSYRVLGDLDRFITAFEISELKRTGPAEGALMSDDAPIVQVVNGLLTQALRDRASDLHIEPQDGYLRIRFRIDGALHDATTLPESMGPALVSRLKIMAELNIVERRRPQDGQFTIEIDGRPIDMRLSVLATIWGEKCVIRLLDNRRSAMPLHELGMPDDTYQAFSSLVRAPFGMVLCAGPTGSGKTTTLYGALHDINEAQRNITTIEDPVEYVFPSINQIQTNDQAGLTFATGLKSILRQDPDVILVGEIRDAETARIAVQSALTGHFVLSTLHGTDAVAALHRLLDMGIESFLIASSVVAVVGQRLVRRICPKCQVPYTPTAEELAFYEGAGGAPKKDFTHGEGCSFCAGTGFQDRIGLYELLRVTPEIKRLIVGWATQEELRRLAVSQGMRTLQEEALTLVEHDVTTIPEIIRTIYSA
jgi:type IV pilus assembly protein PilB